MESKTNSVSKNINTDLIVKEMKQQTLKKYFFNNEEKYSKEQYFDPSHQVIILPKYNLRGEKFFLDMRFLTSSQKWNLLINETEFWYDDLVKIVAEYIDYLFELVQKDEKLRKDSFFFKCIFAEIES